METARKPLRKKIVSPTFWLVIIMLLAALLRLYDLTDEPLELHPTRQFRALIIARAIYYPDAEEIPADQQTFAEEQAAKVGLIEPSILEVLTAQLYRLAGQETTWFGRVFPITAWLLGGLALFSLARQIGSTLGAFLSLVYYLFLPYGARFSRVLMVDPIMVAMTITALWAIYTWQQRRQTNFALLAGLLTGIAILLKSVAGIILIVPFAAYLLSSDSFKSIIKNKQIWLILLLAVLPTGLFYFYGVVIDGRLGAQFKGRFFPEIWSDLVFYKSWGLRIIREFNILAFAAGMIGILVTKGKAERRMLFAWWVGFFSYAMLFAYHTWTHDYYHLPMVPLLALSLAPTIAYLEEKICKPQLKTAGFSIFISLCLGFGIYGSYQTILFLKNEDYRLTRKNLQQLGSSIRELPEGRIIGLTDDYETSFTFYNFLKAKHWPTLGDLNYRALQGAEEQAFEHLWLETTDVSYFFITDLDQLDKQELLKTRLSTYPVIIEGENLILYSITPQP